QELAAWRRDTGVLAATRADQARHWFREDLRTEMLALLTRDPELQARMADLEAAVAAGRMTPALAARAALAPLRDD
ncbi:MAG: methylmalonyl Co-A mutase-associated GTPase MeaB, partial [Alphaproteobacteria bacterium]|nr:methylmalonyl Co-A mutase-associated GTPase MeaB [Alphaproteobacteria bacterium]